MKQKYEFKSIVAETLLIPLYMRADLCPSISNYELVIGKNNLCNIPIE